jgi:hypothetical protein
MTKQPCRYSGHNTDERRATIARPDGKSYWINFPDDEPDDRRILTWIKPIVESLTISYWRDIALDKTLNIKREQCIWVEGLWFSYDYKDGLVEVYDIKSRQGTSGSIYKSLMKLFTISEETKQKIKDSIKDEVTDVTFIDYKEDSKYIKLKI